MEVWSEHVHGSGLNRLAAKLKKSKVALKTWNKIVFGCVDLNIQDLGTRIIELEDILQRG